jgi:hypothetical protein
MLEDPALCGSRRCLARGGQRAKDDIVRCCEKSRENTGKYQGVESSVMLVGMGLSARPRLQASSRFDGLAKPIGSLTQMGTVRLGKRTRRSRRSGNSCR